MKKKALLQLIGTDLSTGITKIDLEKENLYKLPKYYAKDQAVTDALAKANKYASGTKMCIRDSSCPYVASPRSITLL